LTYGKFKDEKEAFAYTWDERNAEVRASFDRMFRERFPQGHFESVRDLVASGKQFMVDSAYEDHKGRKWLNDMHPDAFDFLARYGQDYRPFRWTSWPEFGLGIPEAGSCFVNSGRLMRAFNRSKRGSSVDAFPKWKARADAVYVEGLCLGAISLPMLHAWNAIGVAGKVAFDWTHAAACSWDRYFGFPLTETEYGELSETLSDKPLRYTNIFERTKFPRIRERLCEIAESRHRHDDREAA
jgi:hypothetical protein